MSESDQMSSDPRGDEESGASEWFDVMARSDLREGDVVGVEVQGEEVALYGVQGQVHATADLCTHGFARMSEGFLEGCEIECPIHQGRFDVRSGEPCGGPVSVPLPRHDVRLEGGRIWVRLRRVD
jgi:naphthalene 1,2-dioxygenase system ferredoxin subunit